MFFIGVIFLSLAITEFKLLLTYLLLLPQGVICLVSIYGTHHNPAVWTNPHVRTLHFLVALSWLSVSDLRSRLVGV